MRNPKSSFKLSTREQEPEPLVRWEFLRGSDYLSCLIDRDRTRGMVAVALVGSRGPAHGSAETFPALAGALARHATLASIVGANGWKLAAYAA